MAKKRVLIVGAGGWGRTWARTLKASKEVKIVGWVDIRLQAAHDAAAQLKLRGIYLGTDLLEAISATAPDFVMNLTAPMAHRDIAIQALEAGLPVLCDKPMADTLEHAREMVAASERTGRLLMVNQQRSYDPRLAAMRRLVVDHIGPLSILNSDFYIAWGEAAFHVGMTSPLLLDMAIHTFDAARYVSGADPVAVWCEEFSSPWSWFTGKDSAVAVFEMTDGLRYTYRGSWSSPGFNTPWEADWRAVGPRGTVLWDGAAAPRAEVVTTEPGVLPFAFDRLEGEPDPTLPVGLRAPLLEFLHAIETGETPRGECHDNIKSLAMVFGAVESAAAGHRVTIDV